LALCQVGMQPELTVPGLEVVENGPQQSGFPFAIWPQTDQNSPRRISRATSVRMVRRPYARVNPLAFSMTSWCCIISVGSSLCGSRLSRVGLC
jgi:hypothetical protein